MEECLKRNLPAHFCTKGTSAFLAEIGVCRTKSSIKAETLVRRECAIFFALLEISGSIVSVIRLFIVCILTESTHCSNSVFFRHAFLIEALEPG